MSSAYHGVRCSHGDDEEQILAEAMSLEPSERELLADELWLSVTGETREEIDAAWLEEVRRREAAFARGEMAAVDVDEALARIRNRPR